MSEAVFAHRIQFAFTVMFHYLFPILTMGLGFFIAVYSTLHIVTKDQRYADAAQFWAKIFAINFALGVVTGIPLEFEFGTNWSRFSSFGGGVFGQMLPLEGVYAFFLESGFLGMFLAGERRVGRTLHWLAGLGVAFGSLLSGYFIVATNAWMQHPVGYEMDPSGGVRLTSFWAVLLNPYAGWEYAHTINGALLAAAFVIGGVGAYYLLSNRHLEFARLSVKTAVIAGVILALTQLFPTGDLNSASVVRYQPTKLAAMEGLFETQKGAPLAIIGMPDTEKGKLIDPIYVPKILSFLAYGHFQATVDGLNVYPKNLWPPVELTYYSYHIMVGLGSIFIAQMLIGLFLLWRRKLYSSRWFLWMLMLTVPFPYIANEAGWVVSEVGRQPWLVYGLMMTHAGTSTNVAAGETVFTTMGFAGIYAMLSILFLFLVARIIGQGPEPTVPAPGIAAGF
ncbi:MAG TPA: cytochrome ubiquinol oxidase subunit I [Terriglobia bacterium]|nr:cytochrome ubiquinol oxidase subunit I [Terriglobia bacterium]